ncbi:hypothetical protein [Bordetella sp. LUAb4]|uniref:hypothetical protein n=1 Tax=Bordetella sp. LUAb4 TaxID=2843195 RepID=UPI001E28D1E1|nr:hypothetical protein [Bordetella sp. LUAb4]
MKGTETLAQTLRQTSRQLLKQTLGQTLAQRQNGQRRAAKAALLATAACAAAATSYVAGAESSPVIRAPIATPATPAAAAVPVAAAGCVWPVADSVEALLQAETEIALRTRRGSPLSASRLSGPAQESTLASASLSPSPSASASPTAGLEHADRVAVAAIYGVGRALHVDVRINGQLARYHKGQRWPEHAPSGGAGVYALAAVLGECVRLQSAASARVICLDALGSMEAKRN